MRSNPNLDNFEFLVIDDKFTCQEFTLVLNSPPPTPSFYRYRASQLHTMLKEQLYREIANIHGNRKQPTVALVSALGKRILEMYYSLKFVVEPTSGLTVALSNEELVLDLSFVEVKSQDLLDLVKVF